MKKLMTTLLLFVLCLCVLAVSGAATDGEAAAPADTGDIFSIIITMLLVSAMGVAALVTHKTRFEHEKKDSRQ